MILVYISLVIGFILAVLGALFKNTKTDTTGNPIYSRFGFPSLTGTGIAVVILLSLSFLVSIYLTWDKSKTDKSESQKLTSQLGEVQKQNDKLQRELDRVSKPITNMLISFDASVPLEHPALEGFKASLNTMAKQYWDISVKHDPNVRCLTTPLERVYEIGKRSRYLPDSKSEEVAFKLLGGVGLTILFYKKHLTYEQLAAKNYDPDLKLHISTTLLPDSQTPFSDNAKPMMRIFYNDSRKVIHIVADDVPVEYLTRNSTINSILDLPETQVILILSPLMISERMTADQFNGVFKRINLEYFRMNVSSGQLFECKELKRYENPDPDRLPFYECFLPSQ